MAETVGGCVRRAVLVVAGLVIAGCDSPTKPAPADSLTGTWDLNTDLDSLGFAWDGYSSYKVVPEPRARLTGTFTVPATRDTIVGGAGFNISAEIEGVFCTALSQSGCVTFSPIHGDYAASSWTLTGDLPRIQLHQSSDLSVAYYWDHWVSLTPSLVTADSVLGKVEWISSSGLNAMTHSGTFTARKRAK